ncbi:MAG TPA: RidA family protein [Agitococcus sp.]|nr:RidA family protein [Agitococcus sp.]HNL36408.1 RidA family protein [Agitococcus sp.]HNN28586.1 RidA family protein [Agitococcus sp.]
MIKRLQVATRYSEAAIHHGVVYLAGQVPNDVTQGIEGQTVEVLAMIDDLLAQAGSSKDHLLTVTIYLTDMADYAGMNKVWDAWLNQGFAPPRACVQAALANPLWKVEIVVVAAQLR